MGDITRTALVQQITTLPFPNDDDIWSMLHGALVEGIRKRFDKLDGVELLDMFVGIGNKQSESARRRRASSSTDELPMGSVKFVPTADQDNDVQNTLVDSGSTGLTIAELAEARGIDKSLAKSIVGYLVGKKIVVSIGKGRGTRYAMASMLDKQATLPGAE